MSEDAGIEPRTVVTTTLAKACAAPGAFLHYRGLCCIWMCLQYTTEACVAHRRVYTTKACAAPGRVYTTEAGAAP